ncbi:MAG TPA: hypothetical protein VNW24_04250, partial [Stellaceae bacterium]|nr:hypothetical protein [Stellaceae bacterium]
MAKQFDKQEWLEKKAVKLEDAREALDAGLKALQTSDDWKHLLEAMAVRGKLAISRLSFSNQLLVMVQRPGTRAAATFMTWKRHGRSVKKGEKGLVILAPLIAARDDADSQEPTGDSPAVSSRLTTVDGGPKGRLIGFRPLYVFALEQTEGEALPEPKLPDVVAPEAFDGSVEKLRAVALSLPGQPVTGVELRPRLNTDPPTALGWYAPKARHIVIVDDGGDAGEPRARLFATLCHELAHALLHPLGDPHGTPEREVEAESTAFVVCHALGLDTGAASFPYVGTWASRDGEDPLALVAQSGQRIATAAT